MLEIFVIAVAAGFVFFSTALVTLAIKVLRLERKVDE